MAKKSLTTRKGLAIGLAVVGIAGLSLASAAQLNLTSGSLAAGTTVVAPCDTDGARLSLGASTYSSILKSYSVSTVTLKGVDGNCKGQTVRVDLLNGDPSVAGAPTSLGAGTVTLAPAFVTGDVVVPIVPVVPATPIDAKLVLGAAAVISD